MLLFSSAWRLYYIDLLIHLLFLSSAWNRAYNCSALNANEKLSLTHIFNLFQDKGGGGRGFCARVGTFNENVFNFSATNSPTVIINIQILCKNWMPFSIKVEHKFLGINLEFVIRVLTPYTCTTSKRIKEFQEIPPVKIYRVGNFGHLDKSCGYKNIYKSNSDKRKWWQRSCEI